MPWKEMNKMEQKELFIKEMLRGEKPFKHLCAEFGISEKTGHKWKKRFYEQGKMGLIEQSRASHTHSNVIDGDTAAELICIKNAHLAWGPKKVREIYARKYPDKNTPSLSTVKRILDKAGLVKPRKVKPATTSNCPRLQQQIQAYDSNDVWCIDFKGWWKSNGEICEPFTVRDKYSRKILCAKLVSSKSSETVKIIMTDLFKKYGLPKCIHSDNGTPFAAPNGILNLTSLSAWWITLGILPDRSFKGRPDQNGSLERMHRDIAWEVEKKIPGGVKANQVFLDAWVKEYNSERPNEAIGMKVPNEVYHKSPRKYDGDFDELEYPVGFLVRKVLGSGEIIIRGIRITIGYALRGWQIGLQPIPNVDKYHIFLSDFLLGTLDMDSCCFYPLDELKSD